VPLWRCFYRQKDASHVLEMLNVGFDALGTVASEAGDLETKTCHAGGFRMAEYTVLHFYGDALKSSQLVQMTRILNTSFILGMTLKVKWAPVS
jgi:hypothetical protein